ncbi:Polyadenylate-binding protein/Hyperplastic disc protein [Gymnopus androsaceus JB14]|uniref:Polyadenylate-binding protein/Hyperplastic disc protein n=1 Tax=Gymnopus androsaceus JB14 TaxID=1447944 RepID=A0A6A4IMJ6_9AGAR|nr:Polyadenylate-binding protein/Hyperplastic disc protein [Gymnopus androsaceus JB14]
MTAQFTNLYVKNFGPKVSQEEFEKLFEQFGTVTSAIVQVDEEGKSRGFGFVNYKSHEEAAKAVEVLHDTELNGRKLFVSRAKKKAEREEELRKVYEQAKMEKLTKYEGLNLYIKNLEADVDSEKLRAEFESFGAITSCKVMRDEKGTSKGFGFVCFSSPDEATKAVSEMNNKMIGSKPLYVSLAQRREVRRQQLESQIAQRNQIRMQQAAAAGTPGGYPPGPRFLPQGRGVPAGRGGPPARDPAHEAPAFNTAALANASPMEQKQMLGEHIYLRIAGSQPELAGKITGMLLEMENTELIQLLDSQEAINNKVQEALIVLQEYNSTKEE